jgi:hypothetical protein
LISSRIINNLKKLKRNSKRDFSIKLEAITNCSTWVISKKDFMKKYKQPKSHVILVHVKAHKFHGDPTTLIF